MDLKLVTWNINSVRSHMGIVERFVADVQPDVLCLQEIKSAHETFPYEALQALGYPHIEIHGQKAYHGVATLSKLPLSKPKRRDFCGKGDARHLSVEVAGVEVHNFYIPAGGDEPDPIKNEKFAHKLQFLDELTAWKKGWRGKTSAKRVLVGDLNIAPSEHDVWSHKQLLKIVSHTPVEVDGLTRAFEAGKWVDAVRVAIPEPEPVYSWWSYRAKDWRASNRGRRLDHIWVSEPLRDGIGDVHVYDSARDWEKPSDHAPIVATLRV